MKKNNKILAAFLLCFIFFVRVSFAQADALYDKGYDAYTRGDWKTAMQKLYAYLNYKNPVPSEFSDKVYTNNVTACYNYARSEYILSTQAPRPVNNNDDGLGSSVAGLTQAPPTLRKPKKQIAIMVRNTNFLNYVDGDWQFTINSASGTVTSDRLSVTQDGKIVSGTLTNPAGTQMQVVGSFDTGVLVLICITGLQTTQVFTLQRVDISHFSGSFNNIGKWPDTGTITMAR